MSMLMSSADFAALVGVPVGQVERWRREGLLDPEGLGGFDELDLLRWMTIRDYCAQGYSSDRLAAAIKAGEVSPYLAEYLYPSGPRLGLEEVAERARMSIARVRQILAALGFTRTTATESQVAQLEAFTTMEAAGLPWEAVIEGARVYGDALRRLAETEVRLTHVHIDERLRASGMPDEEVARHSVALQEAVVPLLDALVTAVHHEHLLQAAIEDAHLHLPGGHPSAERGSVQTTIVFLDLESFTELTQAKGDQLASDLLTRLDGAVRTLALEHHGKLVKQIGDGLMLAFRKPDDAAAFAREAVGAVACDPEIPPLHVGIHTGTAIYRAGDYIGTTVNLASRVTSASSAGEILLTEDVAAKLTDNQPIEPVGVRMLRGAERPLKLYRLTKRSERRDPVCGAVVSDPPAARLRQNGDELWFCSEHCLRRFLETSTTTPTQADEARR